MRGEGKLKKGEKIMVNMKKENEKFKALSFNVILLLTDEGGKKEIKSIVN